VNRLIQRLLDLHEARPGASGDITEAEATFLCEQSSAIFLTQPALLSLTAPVTVVGDTHGQLQDLLRIFHLSDVRLPGEVPYLFLGDYVDRGRNSIETICLLLAYKIKFPDTFFMLRGNHECSYINTLYGFRDDCTRSWEHGTEMWQLFIRVFNSLPFAAVIGDRIFCVHGGISPELTSLDQIRAIERPLEIPDHGFICDLVWSDPDPQIDEWGPNERMASVCFGRKTVDAFLQAFGFDLICRGHQAVMGGYDFPFEEDKSILTLFSAPNYCYEFENRGAVLHVDASLTCKFSVVDPQKWHFEDDVIGGRPGTPPRGASGPTPAGLFSVEQPLIGDWEDDVI
jgi:serine/threonine-protein phosphatase PP1 catalytic subunit